MSHKKGIYDIDYAVARKDKQRIDQAIPLLKSSLKSLQQLQSSASGMKAETGNAIVLRSDDLIRSTTRLINRLELHKEALEEIIRIYKETDRATASSIKRSAGGGGGGSFGGGGHVGGGVR